MASGDFATQFKNLKLSSSHPASGTPPQDINILLLGESGIGKSTFINSIANYFHFRKFKYAETAVDIQVLIPSTITLTDGNLERQTYSIGIRDINETIEVGEAATQDVKTYVFPINDGRTRIRLIDTPGMGDRRGVDQDETNAENILNYLSGLMHLHAICFLMSPTVRRISAVFEYCLKQILSRLEKSAVKNIIFIFTHTRGTDYMPSGETYDCLKKVIDGIKARPPNVEIPLNKDNVFSLDNEGFRFLVALRHGYKPPSDDVRKIYVDSWKHSSSECYRLVNYIAGENGKGGLPPHQLRNTTSINEARRLIYELSQPLADITQIIADNIRVLNNRERELQNDTLSLDELKNKLYMPVIDLKVTQMTQPTTVCVAKKCCEVYKVADIKKVHYKQRCHDPCYLTNVGAELIGDPALVGCTAMGGKSTCQRCGCDYTQHMHIYYMTKAEEVRVEDPNVRTHITSKESAILNATQLIENIKLRKREYDAEKEELIQKIAQFACFLQHNAISPYNDAYKTYIQYLIQREQAAGHQADMQQIHHLQYLLQRHEEVKRTFEETLKYAESEEGKKKGKSANPLNPQQILENIYKLYKLKHFGDKIKKLLRSQKASREREYNDSYVHLNAIPMSDSECEQKKQPKKNKNKGKKSDGNTDEEKKGPQKQQTKQQNVGKNKNNQQQQQPRVFQGRQPPPNKFQPHNQPNYNQGPRNNPPKYSKTANANDNEVTVTVKLKQPPEQKKQEPGPSHQNFNRNPNPNYPFPPNYYGQHTPPAGPYGQHTPPPGPYGNYPPPLFNQYPGQPPYYPPAAHPPPHYPYPGFDYNAYNSHYQPPPPYQNLPPQQQHPNPQRQYPQRGQPNTRNYSSDTQATTRNHQIKKKPRKLKKQNAKTDASSDSLSDSSDN